MEPPKHIKTMRSVSSPAGVPPLPSHSNDQSKNPSAKSTQSNELNPSQSAAKDCRRRHTSVLVPSSSYVSEFSSSPVSPLTFHYNDPHLWHMRSRYNER